MQKNSIVAALNSELDALIQKLSTNEKVFNVLKYLEDAVRFVNKVEILQIAEHEFAGKLSFLKLQIRAKSTFLEDELAAELHYKFFNKMGFEKLLIGQKTKKLDRLSQLRIKLHQEITMESDKYIKRVLKLVGDHLRSCNDI